MDSYNRNKQITENKLDFLYELYKKGVAIGHENIAALIEKDYIKNAVKEAQDDVDKINEYNLNHSNENTREADSKIDIIEEEKGSDEKIELITSDELEERRKKYNHRFEGRNKPIEKKEWLPESTTEHHPDFINWINSINTRGFANKIHYRKFTLYCQQAYQWLSEVDNAINYDDEEDRMDYYLNELRRCDENALYFLNKYVYYKEGDAEDKSGRIKYIAAPVHEFMAYMNDCGYSEITVKGRQIAATTTKMALKVRNVVFKANHFMKFITEDVEKAQEIFEDKLKFCFSELPEWMRPNVLNERDNLFKIGYKPEKGKKEGVGSKIMVVAPKRTAVAGGAPQEVSIDEGGNINILGIMIGNSRPTMMWMNPRTKKIEMKRRLDVWGTGGQMDKGGKAFETEYMTIFNDWMEGKYGHCIIPVFFDWTCRPGATQEDYDREKAVAYAKGADDRDPDARKHITEFHQSWPTSLQDVFRTSSKTLIDEEYIESSLTRIREAKVSSKFMVTQKGYFEPIYDLSQPTSEGADVPYKIIDAKFVPTDDLDRRASVEIFMHPERTWHHRYWQGTDPIDTYTGHSNFASTVWDKYLKTPAAILNWRIPDYPQVFLQSLLLGLYYDSRPKKLGIKELVESNRGSSYTDYKKNKGFDRDMVLNYQLPPMFQNNTTINEGVGIDNKGQRNTGIVHRMFEMTSAYGQNFFHSIIFEQFKTFTSKVSDTGKEVWGPINNKSFMDDTLFSTTFSYICAELCFPELQPISNETLKAKKEYYYPLMRGRDGKLQRVQMLKK